MTTICQVSVGISSAEAGAGAAAAASVAKILIKEKLTQHVPDIIHG